MTNALTTTNHEPCALTIPGGIPSGLEAAGDDKIILPRLDIVQSNSDIFKSDNGQGNVRVGQLFNTATKEIISGPVEFIIIKVNRGAFYWDKDEDAFKCRSDDGITSMRGDNCKTECPFRTYWDKWEDGKPPKCKETRDFLVIRRDSILTNDPYFAVISMKVTQIDQAKQIINAAKLSNKPVFAKAYSFDTEHQTFGKKSFYGWKVKPVGWVTQAEFDKALKAFTAFAETAMTVHGEDVPVEETIKPKPSDIETAPTPTDEDIPF